MAAIFAALLMIPGASEAEVPGGGRSPAGKEAWDFSWQATGRLEFTDNLWHLNSDQKDRLEENSAADQTSGRFDDMNEVSDFSFEPELEAAIRGPSPLGRKVKFFADLGYAFYFQNPRRSFLEARIGALQDVGKDGELKLSLGYVPEFFQKNYLKDATDADGNGTISREEREYRAGVWRESDIQLRYRHALLRTPKGGLDIDGELGTGFRNRTFSAFPGRNESAWTISPAVTFEYRLLRWGVRYEYESVAAPKKNEVLVLNGNRVETDVDRRQTIHRFGGFAGLDFGAWEVKLEYQRMLRDWLSSEALDVSHNGRTDVRDVIDLTLKWKIDSSWSARLGYAFRRQTTDRPENPAAETLDYVENTFFVAVTFEG